MHPIDMRPKWMNEYFISSVVWSCFLCVSLSFRLRLGDRFFFLLFSALIWFYDHLDYGYYCQLLFIIHAIRATFSVWSRIIKDIWNSTRAGHDLANIFVLNISTRFQFNWSSIEGNNHFLCVNLDFLYHFSFFKAIDYNTNSDSPEQMHDSIVLYHVCCVCLTFNHWNSNRYWKSRKKRVFFSFVECIFFLPSFRSVIRFVSVETVKHR